MTPPRLNRALLESSVFDGRIERDLLDLPEKVLQFGTGAFLRGFVEYFIDQANRQGIFNGRIVAVSSTGSGRDRQLQAQDGLYTLLTQGIQNSESRQEYRLITALSRALSALSQWKAMLQCASNPELELIFSNTTEVGIRLDDADLSINDVPKSFPAKLCWLLFERARAFDFAPPNGRLTVIPCELIENNGSRLRELVLDQARRWNLERAFEPWLQGAVTFCNTLVDRIVPGEADRTVQAQAAAELGYHDELLTICEPYRLFAIETTERLAFAPADSNIILTDDIEPYRLRKVRLLNGTHTIMTPLALLAGCETVRKALRDELVGTFIRQVLLGELVPSTDLADAEPFAREVLERFANPNIRHALVDITLQQSMKLRVRIVPAILDYAVKTGCAPRAIAFGFAAFLLYVRDATHLRADDQAERLRAIWRDQGGGNTGLVAAVGGDTQLWGTDLSAVPGFTNEVTNALDALQRLGARGALEAHLASTTGVR